jgi:hypothetical protein
MAIEVGDDPTAIVPMDVKAPVVVLMAYIETSFEPALVTWKTHWRGRQAQRWDPYVPNVPMRVKAPVVRSILYIEMVLSQWFVT